MYNCSWFYRPLEFLIIHIISRLLRLSDTLRHGTSPSDVTKGQGHRSDATTWWAGLFRLLLATRKSVRTLLALLGPARKKNASGCKRGAKCVLA